MKENANDAKETNRSSILHLCINLLEKEICSELRKHGLTPRKTYYYIRNKGLRACTRFYKNNGIISCIREIIFWIRKIKSVLEKKNLV